MEKREWRWKRASERKRERERERKVKKPKEPARVYAAASRRLARGTKGEKHPYPSAPGGRRVEGAPAGRFGRRKADALRCDTKQSDAAAATTAAAASAVAAAASATVAAVDDDIWNR